MAQNGTQLQLFSMEDSIDKIYLQRALADFHILDQEEISTRFHCFISLDFGDMEACFSMYLGLCTHSIHMKLSVL